MFGDGLLDVIEFDAQTFSFDNELLDFVLEQVRFFRFGRRGPLGNNSSGAGTDFEKTSVD